MNYRKRKKFWTKLLKQLADILTGNPFNAVANSEYKYVLAQLNILKEQKYENMGSNPNARANGSDKRSNRHI